MIGRLNALRVLLELPTLRSTCLSLANKAGHTPLELAALRGHWKTVEDLLDEGATLGCAGPAAESRRAEHLVAELLQRRYYNCAARLVAAGLGAVTAEALEGRVPPETLEWVMLKSAESHIEDDDGKCLMLLRRALDNCMADVVTKLLKRSGVRSGLAKDLHDFLLACGPHDGAGGPKLAEQLIDACKEEGELALGRSIHAAAEAGWAGLLGLLLRARPEDQNWPSPATGATALGAACALRRAECIFLLLNAGAATEPPDKEGSTPLMHSCRRNHCAAVAALLGAGASVLRSHGHDGSSSGGGSALALCCTLGRPEILEMLLAKCERSEGKGRLQAEVAQLGCLQLAAEHDQASCIRVLLQHGADAQHRSASAGETALHVAARHGCHASATVLLEFAEAAGRPCVDAKDDAGRTPLHLAVKRGQVLLVRLLRCSGAETQAKDASGCVPAAYCCGVAGDVAAAIRAELLDPAQPVLLEAARTKDNGESCSALKYIGLPGYLSGRQCVDLHAGDGWTPLMEAVVCGNLAFARALAGCGAELQRRDQRGLSALFWAKALQGHDAAMSLASAAPSRPEGPGSAAAAPRHVVRCKDGEMQVSAAAHKWMEANFPAAAAAAVPCATLAVTLRAQQLDCEDSQPTGAEGGAEASTAQPGLLDEAGAAAFARLREAAGRDVRDAMVLEMGGLSAGEGRTEEPLQGLRAAPQPQYAGLRQRMATDGAFSNTLTDEQLRAREQPTHASSASFSAVDFLQSLASDETRWPQSSQFRSRGAAMSCLLARSRVGAIGTVAAAGEDQEPLRLGLQQAFLLHVFAGCCSIRSGLNGALASGEELPLWAPMGAALREAMEALPPTQEELFRLVEAGAEAPQHREGSVLAWSGFASATASWPSLLPEDQESLRSRAATGLGGKVLYRIRPRLGARQLSRFSPAPASAEAVLLPHTRFRVVRVGSFAVPANAQKLLRQVPEPPASKSGDGEGIPHEERMTVVTLEEL